MNRNIELILKDVGKLDIDSKLMNEFGLEVSYAISDIEDLGSRKSNYSKSFKLIGTPTNNKHFKHIYDINFESLTFDMNARQDCYLTLNKNVVIDGYLKIRSINKVYVAGKYQIIYEVNLYDEIKNIFNEFGSKKLSDLDFSEGFTFMNNTYDVGNHIFNLDTIEDSQSRIKDFRNVYEYPIVNYNYDGINNNGNNFPNTGRFEESNTKDIANIDINQMYPSVYIKPIIDKMFYDIGYSYSSDFFEGLTFNNMFNSLATIYNGEKILTNKVQYSTFKLSVDRNSSIYQNYPISVDSIVRYDDIRVMLKTENENLVDNAFHYFDGFYEKGYFSINNNIKIRSDGNYDFELKYLLQSLNVGEVGSELIIFKNDDEIYIKEIYDEIYEDGLIEETFNIDFKKDDLVSIKVKYIFNEGGTDDRLGQAFIYDFYCNITLNIEDVESKLDTTLLLNEFLPNLTQAEFLKSLISQFNLKITIDKENEKNLLIETRPEYYNTGKIIDWNNKVNETQYKIEPTTKKIKRYYNFNMSKIDSYWSNEYLNNWSNEYLNNWSNEYGSKRFDYGSDVVTGENNVDSKFGGYNYIEHNNNVKIPNLVKDLNDNISTKKRSITSMIGFISNYNVGNYKWSFLIPDYEPTIEFEWVYTFRWVWQVVTYEADNLRPQMTNINTINHIENFDNNTIQYDLNFETKGHNDVNANSYNNFWRSEVENLTNNNNRIVTYFIDLNIEDIINLDFRNTILIKNDLYYLQNLVTDINSDNSSKIELIKAFDYVKYSTPEVLPLIWGLTDVGSVVAGVNRPTANTILLDSGYVNYINTKNDINLNPDSTIENYLWFATPNQGVYNKKHSWFVDEWNNGGIGGDENLGGNLFPDPILVDYNGNSYNVYVGNYQTNIETIKFSNETVD